MPETTLRTFLEIERQRSDAGISRMVLCGTAGLHHSVYSRALRRPFHMNVRSLRALNTALDALLLMNATARGEAAE